MQSGLLDEQKDFYDILWQTTSKTNDSMDMLYKFYKVHGGHGIGPRNEKERRLLEFYDTKDQMISNTNFRKSASYLITYKSSDHASQVDYVLTKTCDLWLFINAKSFPGEECTPQHRLVISDSTVQARIPRSKPVWKRRIYKLWDLFTSQIFRDVLTEAFNEN